MKIKMLKLGTDIENDFNTRLRGIVETGDKKYLFIELERATRLDRKYLNIEPNEYNLKYPNEEYIFISDCFRVDLPKDYYEAYTPELENYDRKPFHSFAYTKDDMIRLLQQFNKNIDDIELCNDYDLNKFCEEKGFFKLYDGRLKHNDTLNEIIRCELYRNDGVTYKGLYTYYSASNEKFTMEREAKMNIRGLIHQFGRDIVKKSFDEYMERRLLSIRPEKAKEYTDLQYKLLDKNIKDAQEEIQNDIQEETIDI